jgi:hypothetical protein
LFLYLENLKRSQFLAKKRGEINTFIYLSDLRSATLK